MSKFPGCEIYVEEKVQDRIFEPKNPLHFIYHVFLFIWGEEYMSCYKAPLFVDFDVTLACNMKCTHCNLGAQAPLENELSLAEVKHLVTEMFDIGVYNLEITGGEPLMRKDWREIVLHTHQYPAWKLTLNTNGVLWTEDDVQFFAEEVPSFYAAVSVDGPTPETYGIMRRNASGAPAVREFENVMRTVQLLKEYGAQVGLNYTITRNTIDNFVEMAHVAQEMGVQVLGLKFFPYGRGKANLSELELDYKTWAAFLREATKRKDEGGLENAFMVTPCPWEMYVPLLTAGYTEEDVTRFWGFESPLRNDYYRKMRDVGCNAGVTYCAVSSDGSVYPCGTISAETPALYCGNIRDGGLLSVWQNSPFLTQLRELSLSQIEGHCHECEFSSVCGGGCRARAVVSGRELESADPLCPFNVEKDYGCELDPAQVQENPF